MNMIEDDSHELQKADSGLGMLYDWFKFLTSLSLISLGGVLGLVQAAGPGEIKKTQLIAIVVTLVASLITSFSGAGAVVQSQTKGTPLHKSTNVLLGIAGMSLSVGLGIFFYIFVAYL